MCKKLKFSALVLIGILLSVNQVWGADPVASQTPGNGTFVVVVYDATAQKYYALPNATTNGGTLAGVEVSVNSSGQVTTTNPPTWTLTKGTGDNANYYHLTYTSGSNTYKLYKNGTGKSNYNFKVSTGDVTYWSFSGSTSAGYTVVAEDRGTTNNVNIQCNSGTFRCYSSASAVRLLTVAPSGYTVDYVCNGATSGCPSQATGQTALPNPLPTPAKTGCTFEGWYTDSGFETAAVAGASLTGAVTLYAKWCKAPTSVTISSDAYQFYPNEAIELTADPTGSPEGSPVTYQWQRNGVDVGTNSNTYAKAVNTTTAADAGSYTCTISYGSCSTTSAGYDLKCMQFYLKDASGNDISNHALTKVDATHATLSLSLTGNTTYKFRVTDGCNNWYGNTGEMTSSNCTNWHMDADADCRITTGSKTASYTFNFDFTDGLLGSQMKVSVVYPSSDQASGKVIYWDNEVNKWDGSKLWYRIGKSTHNSNTQLTKVAGTANLYSVTTSQYNGFEYWHIANNEGNGTGNIFWTKGDAAKAITAAMGYEGSPVTDATVTVTPTTSHSTGSGDNDNCEFYTYSITSGVKTYTVTSSATNCTVSMVKYTNDAGTTTEALASGGTVMATQYIKVTVTPTSGYEFGSVTVTNGTTVTAAAAGTPGVYYITGNATVTATCSLAPCTVTWYAGGTTAGYITTAGDPSTSVTYNNKVTTLPTNPDGSACDKVFVGWTNTTSYTHGTSMLFTDVAGSPTITGTTNFYAVYATESGSAVTYNLVSDAASFTDGTYVVGALADDTYYFMDGTVVASTGLGVETTGLATSSVSDGSFASTSLPSGAIEIDVEDDEDPDGDDHYYFIYYSDGTDTYYMDDDGTKQSLTWTTNTTVYTYHPNFTQNAGTDGCVLLSGSGAKVSQNGSTKTSFIRNYASSGSFYNDVYFFKKSGGTTYSGYTITCSDCATSVTPTFTAAPTGGTVAVTRGGSAVTSGSTVKTCSSIDLSVTITPASHYTLTGFTASGLTTGTATISPAVGTVLPTTSAQTFTVTVSASATGTLNLTPVLTEDTHIAINWNVNGSNVDMSSYAAEGLTWVYSGGDITALPDASLRPVPAGCSGTKVFAGWSEKHSDATPQNASYYDDLFTSAGPTGITSTKTYYAVYATSDANPLAGTVLWDEPFVIDASEVQPSSPTSGATVYGSASISYNCASTDYCKIYDTNIGAGGTTTASELLVPKSSRSEDFTATGIPTGGQLELTLTYYSNQNLSVTTGTSGVSVGDASKDGYLYTRTITIASALTTSFSLTFAMGSDNNGRLDDIHLVVPGSASLTDYVTMCAPSYTITYNKNTSDAVTNLPSPTSVLQSTEEGVLSNTIPTRATYTFVGWSNTSGENNTKDYNAGGAITGVTADKTIYAVWTKTPVEEITINYTALERYVGDPTETLEVTGVVPIDADPSVTWSSDNSSVASVGSATGVVTFGVVGTATITATSTVTGTTTATCNVTVRNKPTVTFHDLIHNLDEDKDGTALSTYNIQDVAGTAVTFPVLADQSTDEDCAGQHYHFVGWTASDNNDDPEDHLVSSYSLEYGVDKDFYAVWADGVEGMTYTKLTSNSFKTSPAKYVIGVESEGTYYFYSCSSTDANNSWGYTSNAPATDAPIQFTLSGTAAALVATSSESTARYLTPLTAKNFQMSATSKTVQLDAHGTIHNPSNADWNLRGNSTNLRWYDGTTGTSAYFYEVTAGSTVSYRTSCCTNNVAAPSVTATSTAYTATLTWAAVDGATGYEVSWNGGSWTAASSPVNKTSLTASTTYTYKVRATYDPLVKCGALTASGSVTTDGVYTVTYAKGSGTGECTPTGTVTDASSPYEAGATVTLQANSYSLSGHTFNAWVVKDADDNDVAVSNNQFTMPASNVTITATWTAVQDKYYDRMHQSTDASHGGIVDGEGKYYLVREGCNYTVPAPADDSTGDTDCHTTHFKLLGWIAKSHVHLTGEHAGEIKTGEESYLFTGGGTKTATGATYYAIYAIMTE